MADRLTEVLARRRGGATSVSDGDPTRELDLLGPGAPVGSWRITARIAEGGCGVVYAARHAVLDREAAVKILRAGLVRSADMLDRFVREARAVNRIKHPNIIDIFDFGTLADGRPYFVMELLAPGDLHERIAASGPLSVAAALAVVTPICLALDATHRAGYIHRDLKARNIGFARRPDGEQVVLLDFGVAKLLEADRGLTGSMQIGTPTCMSPEQIRGEPVDARADVYALGVLVFHLLVGRNPFQGSLAEIEDAHLHAPPPLPSRHAAVPEAFDAVVARAMAKRAADRHGSVREVLDELTAAAAATPARVDDALAIRVEVALPAAFGARELAIAGEASARAAELLQHHGFTLVLVTGTSAIAADRLGGDPGAVRARAAAAAAAIDRGLSAIAGLRWSVRRREGQVEVDHAGGLVGGPLLELHGWRDG